MRLAVTLLLAASFAGCMTPGPADDATAGRASFDCPAGQAVVGFDANGTPACAALLPARTCDAGQYLRGFDAAGALVCEPLVPATTVYTGREAVQEVSSNLKVLGVYGTRPDTAHDLDALAVNLEMAAGALPLDMTQVVVRYSDGATATNYAYGGFSATWIRGENHSAVMQAGDLVELRLALPAPLLTRTMAELVIIPETGAPVSADFKTPATYGTDTTITLR